MRLIPADDAVVAKPIIQAERTGAGVYIPEDSQKLLDEAEVREIGRELVDRFRVGDRIVYSRYSGTILKFSQDGIGALGSAEEFIILDEDDITAIVMKDDDPRLASV